jgi:hypothetical protein
MENDENGNPAVKLEFSELCSYGTNSMGDTGNFFAHLMFRKPLDLPEKTPDAINKTNETYEDQEPDQPLYCSLMQKLYTDSSNEPCDYDFTGMGMDLNKSWENDEWKLTLHAVTGCDWIVFYFYDIEPKQGQTYEQVMAEHRFLSLNLDIGDNMEHNGMTSSMPGEYGSFDGDVWHFFGMASSTTGRPLFRQEDAKGPALLHFTLHQEAEGVEEPFTIVTPDFEVKEYPLTESMPAEFFASLNAREDCSPEYLDLISQNPLTRCAVTPFGVLGFSDSCSGLGDRNSSYSNSICWLKSAEEAADDLFLLYFCNYGISNINGEGTVYVNALFRKPTDPQTFDWNNP